MSQRVTLFPPCTLPFSPAIATGSQVIRQASFAQTQRGWQADMPYLYKALFTDEIAILVHTESMGRGGAIRPSIAICDHNKNVITTGIDAIPYFKGYQAITGNYYYVNGIAIPLITTLWSFSFNDFISDIPNGGIYYLKVTNHHTSEADIVYFSEPIFLSDSQPNTQFYEGVFNANKSGNANVIVSGWYSDYPTNLMPFVPVFSARAEGYCVPSDVQAVNIGYLQQDYRQLQLKTEMTTLFKNTFGEISIGAPWYLLQWVTQLMLADSLWIDGTPFIIFNPNSNTSLASVWKLRSVEDVKQLFYASCMLIFVSEAQNALLSPPIEPFKITDDTSDDTFA